MGAPAAAAHSAELGMELALQWSARARPPPACAGVGGAGEAEEGAEGVVEEGVAGSAAAGGAAADVAASKGRPSGRATVSWKSELQEVRTYAVVPPAMPRW